jgi:hypothetical protein
VLRSLPSPLANSRGITIVLARALASSSKTRDEGASLLAHVARDDFDGLLVDMFWSTALIFAAETAALVGNVEVAATVARLLEPFADQVAVAGNWAVAPIAYGVAVAAGAAERADADAYFSRALETATSLRAPVLRAQVELGWGRVLLAQGRPPRDQVLSLVDDARDTFAERGVDRGVRAAEELHVAAVGAARPVHGTRPQAS